jgi:predicted enzyme related to lactoylglutathione lyase
MSKVRIGNLNIDTDDTAKLQEFYASLFGWKKVKAYGAMGLETEDGFLILFNHVEKHENPVWPLKENSVQRQMHLDIQVENVRDYVNKAIELGAVIAVDNTDGEFVTIQDPSGHPFCLCDSSNQK